MKRLLFIILSLVLFAATANAQKLEQGNLDFLKGEKRLNIVIDYSEAVIYNLDAKDFFATGSVKDANWEKTVKGEMWVKFAVSCNASLAKRSNLIVGDYSTTKYTVTIKVNRVIDGGTTSAEAIFTTSDSTDVLAVISLKGEGGTFGSKTNLMGDGMREAGTKLGSFLARKIK